MYTAFEKIFKLISYTFRIIQFLGLIYFLLFILYWFFMILNLPFAYYFDSWYYYPMEITNKILGFFNFNFSNEYYILRPDIMASIFFTLIAFMLYNFLFIPLDRIERFFVEKSYDKGEKKTHEL